MMAVAPHHWYVQPILAFNISIGVGYCFIHSKGNAKTRVWDKAISSCTFFVLSAFIRELGSATIKTMSIQHDKANEIEKEWGNKECSHPEITKEYYRSSQTGDYRCRQCGATFTEEEVKSIKMSQSKH